MVCSDACLFVGILNDYAMVYTLTHFSYIDDQLIVALDWFYWLSFRKILYSNCSNSNKSNVLSLSQVLCIALEYSLKR